MRTIRIGSGAGFSNDRVEPGIELLEKGQLDYFCLECLAERTIAIAQKEKNLDPNIGYNPYLAYRMKKILPIACLLYTSVWRSRGGFLWLSESGNRKKSPVLWTGRCV